MVMVFNATLIIFQLLVYHVDQFYWWMKQRTVELTRIKKQ